MRHTLVGHTGFVGGNLAAAHSFDALYNSANIEQSFGADIGLVVYCGMPGDARPADADPETDLARARQAMQNIERMKPERLVLLSTVDVYGKPAGVYEDSPAGGEGLSPYGSNRLALEGWVHEAWPEATVLRLPAVFGRGLQRNFIFDMLRGGRDALRRTDSRALFQFYDLAQLWGDVNRCLKLGLPLVNLATAPVEAGALHHALFGEEYENHLQGPPPRYDVRTRYGREFGGHDDYIADQTEVIACIAKFAGGAMREGLV